MDFEFVRGDTYSVKFQITDADKSVLVLEDGDELIFTMKTSYKTNKATLQKRLSKGEITATEDGYYHITFSHLDTAELKYGTYVYDIQLMSEDLVSTIALGSVTLTEEATFLANE